MELPSLEEINPIFTTVYLQLNCFGTDYNYLFKSSPDLFFNSFNKAIVNYFILCTKAFVTWHFKGHADCQKQFLP